jgi:hypothetical protein
MKLSTLKRKAAKEAKANGHSLRWGNVYGNATWNVYSQNGTCKHCGAGVACHEHVGLVYTRCYAKTPTIKRQCKDVVAEIKLAIKQ